MLRINQQTVEPMSKRTTFQKGDRVKLAPTEEDETVCGGTNRLKLIHVIKRVDNPPGDGTTACGIAAWLVPNTQGDVDSITTKQATCLLCVTGTPWPT
jgi:hypothetical protein